jgi:hypothetical protein
VHDLSQIFTGAIYDILADMFELARDIAKEDEAATLLRVGNYLFGLLLRAIMQAPDTNATFADVANEMLALSEQDEMPEEHRISIRNHFALREVFEMPSSLTAKFEGGKLKRVRHPHLVVQANGLQNRSACCGTMRLREYSAVDVTFAKELDDLRGQGIGGSDKKNGSDKKKPRAAAE